MKQLQMASVLDLADNLPAIVSFIGGGGKTAIIAKLAAELNRAGQKVLITTTTKFYPFPGLPLFTTESNTNSRTSLRKHFLKNDIAVLGRKINAENKVEGLSVNEFVKLKEDLPVTVLVEADGSKGLPVKGYNPYEPVIPECTDLVITLAGADALGKPIAEGYVHRPQQLANYIKVATGSFLDEDKLALVFNMMHELALKQAPQAKVFYMLNKLDLLNQDSSVLLRLAKVLSEKTVWPECLMGIEANSPEPVKTIFSLDSKKLTPAVSAIVLAAGSAKRMGRDKLSLPCKQHTILEETLSNVKESGVEEIIVVVQPGSRWVDKFKHSDYIIVENKNHHDGQATSLKAGLNAVSNNIQGALFVLGDQPSVKPDLYNELIIRYQCSLKHVTVPIYRSKRGNPVIFDRRTWNLLFNLVGDEGGRSLIKELDESLVDYVKTGDNTVLLDIDTPDDYLKILNSFSNS